MRTRNSARAAQTGGHYYCRSIELTNVRSFGRCRLDLVTAEGVLTQWTVIIGENGVGKTTLLECLAMMRPVLTVEEERKPEGGQQLNVPKPKRAEPALLRQENKVLLALARKEQGVVEMKAEFIHNGRLGERTRKRSSVALFASMTFQDGKLTGLDSPIVALPGGVEPLVIGYGAGRHARHSTAEVVTDDLDPVLSLFDPASELIDARKILEDLDYASYKKQPRASAFLAAVKAALARLLPDVADADAIHLYGPATPGSKTKLIGVQVDTPYGLVPLEALSLGYQTMAAWTVDLAWKLYNHYPDSTDPLLEPAIVLIDELDLHLHPLWQRELRKHISAIFENVQFVATVHSPLMAQTYLDTNIAVIRRENDQAVVDNYPDVARGWSLDQIVRSSLYEVNTAYSPEVEADLSDRQKLLAKGALGPGDRQRLAELDDLQVTAALVLTPEDVRALDVVRRAARLMEDR